MGTLKRQNLDMNYFKILGVSQLIIRLALYNVVNNTNDLWLHYSYSFVDLLLVFPILKDYDRLTKKTTIFCLGVNLLSFLLYLNIDFINIIPFYLITLYAIYYFDKKMLCFCYAALSIYINHEICYFFLGTHYYHLHFMIKFCMGVTFMLVLMTIYRTERQLLYLSKLFPNFDLQILFLVLILFTFEIEYYGEMNHF